jgi:hypothetical protein
MKMGYKMHVEGAHKNEHGTVLPIQFQPYLPTTLFFVMIFCSDPFASATKCSIGRISSDFGIKEYKRATDDSLFEVWNR